MNYFNIKQIINENVNRPAIYVNDLVKALCFLYGWGSNLKLVQHLRFGVTPEQA